MFELETGFLVGSITAPLEKDLVEALESAEARGYMVVSDYRSAAGYRIPYFRMPGSVVTDVDGIQFIQRLVKSTS